MASNAGGHIRGLGFGANKARRPVGLAKPYRLRARIAKVADATPAPERNKQ
jgi:hypothetical protein